MAQCVVCGKTLIGDEVAINRRMVGRTVQTYRCKECLAAWWECDVEKIEEKIKYFRKNGCTLFAKK